MSAAFNCNQGNFNPFFQFCNVAYTSGGALTIAFWVTDPVTNPAGTHQGIAPLPAGCPGTPDAPGCGSSGHFALSLADTFDIHAADQSGGWSFDKNPLLFNPGGPVFTVLEIQTAFGAIPTE